MNLLDTVLTRARRPLSFALPKAADDSPLYRLHPDLAERLPILRVYSDEQPQTTQTDFHENAGYYERQAWVHRAVKILSDNACPLPARVVTGAERESEALPSHEITELLANPNPETSPADLWRAWITDMMLGGEHGLEAVKAGARYKELWNRPPPDFAVKPGELGKRYKRVAYYTLDDGEGQPYRLPPEEFVHLKFYNPLNPWRGLAPIAAIRMSIIIDQLAQVWSRLFFRNNARPDFAVIAPEGLTKTEREEMELKLWTEHGGTNQHRPIVLEQGVSDIKTFAFPPKDVEWLTQREFSRDEIGAIFGVPDEIMGYGKDTYENFDTARQVLWTLTIIPILSLRDDNLTRFFRKYGKLKADERVETDYSNVPELQEDVTEKLEQMKILTDIGYSPNDANEYLGLGLPEIEEPEPPAPPSAEPLGETDEQAERLRSAPLGDIQRKLKRYFQDVQGEVLRALRKSRLLGRGKYQDGQEIPVGELFERVDLEEFYRRFLPDFIRAFSVAAISESHAPNEETARQMQAALRAYAEQVIMGTLKTEIADALTEAERKGESVPAIQERLNNLFGEYKAEFFTCFTTLQLLTAADEAGRVTA